MAAPYTLVFPPYPVPGAGVQVFAIFVRPHFFGVIAIFQEDGFGIPVLPFAWEKGSPLQDQNFFPRLGLIHAPACRRLRPFQ